MANDPLQRGLDAAALWQVLELTRELARPIELSDMLTNVIDVGRAALQADRGTVFLYEAETDELVVRVATGIGTVRLPAGRGIVGDCVRTRQIINVPDCYADPRFNSEVDRQTGYRTRSLISVPLIGHDDDLVGVLQLLNKAGGPFDAHDEALATALAAQCAVALQRARLTERVIDTQRLERELAVAREIQIGFLPREMPVIEGYDVAGMSEPAEETGGDTFDLVPLRDGRLVILMGDATGHGVGPALSATQVRAMLRMACRLGSGLDDTLIHINEQLYQDLAANRFVTAVLGMLDPQSHRMQYHAAGQGPLLHFRASGGVVEWRSSTTFPMGAFGSEIRSPGDELYFEPGDVLVLFTDGVFETENDAGESFGTNAVSEIVQQSVGLSSAELMEEIRRRVTSFRGPRPQEDDVTIVVVRRVS